MGTLDDGSVTTAADPTPEPTTAPATATADPQPAAPATPVETPPVGTPPVGTPPVATDPASPAAASAEQPAAEPAAEPAAAAVPSAVESPVQGAPAPQGSVQKAPPPADAPPPPTAPGAADAHLAELGFEATSVTVITVTQYTRRSDRDVLPGHFARILTGPHTGEIGVFESVVSNGPDGFPDQVNLTLRNSGEHVVVSYADIVPTPFGGR